jgi:hypothetical protein
MQPPIVPIRADKTSTQVIYEIEKSPALRISSGAELLDMGLNVIDDITNDLVDGKVARSNYATLHGTAQLLLSRELAWGRAIVRPYMRLNGIRFNLGAYFTNTPDRVLGAEPLVYDVQCYDLLDALNTPAGEAYTADANTSYLFNVENILKAQGFTKLQIDQTRVGTTLPSARVWPMDSNTTWLNIVNDLLGAVGYRGIWSDWDGYLRCEPYLVPGVRPVEWTYDATDESRSLLGVQRTVRRDYYKAPNKWVAIRSNNVDGPTPVEGAGVYTYLNEYRGLTSIEARGGRVITSILQFDAADQAALVSQTMNSVETDLRLQTKYSVQTSPNPLHWHFDKLVYRDGDVGSDVQVMSNSWDLPLNGGDMTHEWTEINS